MHHVLTKGMARLRGDRRDRRWRRPAAGHHRARPRRGRPAHPHRSRARAQGGAGRPRRGDRVRLGAARLPAVARRAHRGRADRRRRRTHPAAVRDALPPRRGPAARHRPRRAPLHQPRPRGVGRAADVVRRPHQPRAHRAGDDLRDLRPRGVEPPIPKTIRFAEAPAAGRSILATLAQQQGREGLPRGGRASRRAGCHARAARRTLRGRRSCEPPSQRRPAPLRAAGGRCDVA